MEMTSLPSLPEGHDFNERIPWDEGVNLDRHLLPVEKKGHVLGNFSPEEVHAFSWMLGLLAASAIKEHEKVLNELRPAIYPEGKLEGLTFFLEEAVHSEAYHRFLHLSAGALNVTSEELASFLPQYPRNGLIAKIYELEARLGGKAIWWTVAATEEESIRLFQKLSPHKQVTDRVFYELNRAHFLEESRHSSFSYQMIRTNGNILAKFSFGLSRVLQTVWLLNELSRFRNVKTFRHRHPLLGKMARLTEKFDSLSFRKKLTLLFRDISYTRMLSRPETHPRLLRTLKSEKVLMFRFPEIP